ncbi:decapping and exoribonuclease protein-like isoform X2 [Prorops nasuta]|uniref:decapping and exoribonuclease protein-like isoform X2 n=1 Tax=Prorops nasuta TaxID=863751 RepID=UPI0034CD56B9
MSTKSCMKINSKLGPCPDITDIKVVGYYSIVEEEDSVPKRGKKLIIKSDCSKLRFYKHPNGIINYDLNITITRDKVTEKTQALNYMLKWISENMSVIQEKDPYGYGGKPHFVSIKGTIGTLLCTPSEKRDGWIICAVKFQDVIYLSVYKEDKESQTFWKQNNHMSKFTKWGFKFEQYVLSDSPDSEPKPAQPVVDLEEFCCVFRAQFGKFTLLYRAEIDGVKLHNKADDLLKQKAEFVEVKTNGERYDYAFKHKLRDNHKYIKWWAQSYLANTQTIICGFRNPTGIVKSIKIFKLSEIEENIACSDKCKRSALQILTYIHDNVVKNYDECIYKFSFDVDQQDTIFMQELSPSNEKYNFLPKDFIEKAMSYENSNTA